MSFDKDVNAMSCTQDSLLNNVVKIVYLQVKKMNLDSMYRAYKY